MEGCRISRRGSRARRRFAGRKRGSSQFEGVTIEKYLLSSQPVSQVAAYFVSTRTAVDRGPVLLWMGENGKVWPAEGRPTVKYVDWMRATTCFRSTLADLGRRGCRTRQRRRTIRARATRFGHAYLNPSPGVLSDYVYNSMLAREALSFADDRGRGDRNPFFRGSIRPSGSNCLLLDPTGLRPWSAQFTKRFRYQAAPSRQVVQPFHWSEL